MSPLFEAARDLQNLLDGWRWPFCIIGGIALLRWGAPRYTRDVDVALLSGFGHEDDFTLPLLNSGYTGRISHATEFARGNRVLLVTAPNGVPVDISLAALPFEEKAVQRATMFEFAEGCSLRTCSAEDLLVMKLFALRPQDVADVESVAVLRGASLDWNYVEENLVPLAEAKEDSRIMAAFADLHRRYRGR